MSYLNSPRLTFAGQFQADPSTVNNDPNHFNNATFQPSFQEFNTPNSLNGWWNPEGTGNWRFIGCRIMSVTYKDGTTAADPKDDPVIGMSIMDSGSRVAGKIVDLDSEQQSVSMLWGLTVRIVSGEVCLVKGDFEPIAFNDIWWVRSSTLRASSGASAAYQSVLDNLEWSKVTGIKSRYLDELKAESPKRLSIKFNVDIYSQDRRSAQFTLGRVVGSIGPSKIEEPKHFVIGRQFIPPLTNQGGAFLPSTNVYMATAVVDEKNSRVVLDLGNSLGTAGPDGTISGARDLMLAVSKGPQNYENLVPIDYKADNWYETNGGVVSIPLTTDQLADVQKYPMAITDGAITNSNPSLMDEAPDYVRADQFVFRMNPGEEAAIDFYVSHLGKPWARQSVCCQFSDSLINIMGQGNGVPPTATPNILSFDQSTVTDASGRATVKVTAGDPENPRGFIDGQVYALWYYIKGRQAPTIFTFDVATGAVTPPSLAGVNPTNFISILVFDSVPKEIVRRPAWEDIEPVMQQYANLYPLMSKGVFNLGDKTVVDQNAEILKFVFSKDKTDPNYMPATRDLSRDKQQMIINYLDGVLAAAGAKKTVTIRKS